MANLLGMTLENVRLFEQVATVQHQWEYTFDSIGDPILVHDLAGRILRSNQRLSHLLGREGGPLVGRSVTEDRKSTRLNSSHSQISYAVFCLKKKKPQ